MVDSAKFDFSPLPVFPTRIMKSLRLIVLSVLIATLCACLHAQDTLFVRDLQVTPGAMSKNISGIEIKCNVVLKAKSAGLSAVRNDNLVLYLMGGNGNIVGARSSNEEYRDTKGQFKVQFALQPNKKDVVSTTPVTLFLPYYAINLPAGKQTLLLRPRLKRSFSGTAEEVAVEFVNGEAMQSIEMPAVTRLQISLPDVKVAETNLNGKTWDDKLGINEPNKFMPDLKYKLLLEGAISDEVYTSPEVKNSYTAQWPNAGATLSLTDKDKVTLIVIDEDDLKEERIGVKNLNLKALQDANSASEPLEFDRVEKLKLVLTTVK